LSDLRGFSKIQLRKRSLYSLYPENKKEIKKLLRKNKINFTNEYSAIQTLKLLDSAGLFK